MSGSFTFSDSGNDVFTFSDLGAIAGLSLSSGSDFTISFGDSGSSSGSADIAEITFAVPIPEPSSIILLTLVMLGIVGIGNRKRVRLFVRDSA